MAGLLSKGITLSKGDVVLTNLQEIPDLGGTTESVEVTTLDDAAHMYINGLISYGDSLDFIFLYEKEQFATLSAGGDSTAWTVTLPDASKCSFSGAYSVKIDGVGVEAPITYTLSIKPDSEMTWA